ncbi:DUF917 family protein [Alkalimarinus coralli]|uniref:S-methyl thiohydantoin desulfurase domain-containing protein n=1 Tax=Alkalimarinus coralli TaxID=2935863 RepID=UPI00202AD3D4|nr:DUF917 family protein [Alkalimarinus coralli]
MRELDRDAVENIAKGACFLGSGGGGPLSITPAIIDNIFKCADKVEVVEMDEVADSAGIAIAAGMGSPQGATGMTFDTAASVAFNAVADQYGSLDYVAAVEVGAANSVVPMLVAVQNNIPLVDANGAGRAVPTLPSTTYAQSGVPATPAVLSAVGVPGNPTVTCPSGYSAEEVEDWAQQVLTTNPNFTKYNSGAVALWAFNGKKLNEGSGPTATAVGGSLELAESIGGALDSLTPVESVTEVLKGAGHKYNFLGTGKVIAVKEESVGALDGGLVQVSMDSGILELPYLNEFLGAFSWNTTNPIYILGPDMICCMTPDGEPLSNPSIKSKFEESGPFDMAIFAIQASEAIRNKEMFDLFASHIKTLFPAFSGGYQQPGTLTMQWAWT